MEICIGLESLKKALDLSTTITKAKYPGDLVCIDPTGLTSMLNTSGLNTYLSTKLDARNVKEPEVLYLDERVLRSVVGVATTDISFKTSETRAETKSGGFKSKIPRFTGVVLPKPENLEVGEVWFEMPLPSLKALLSNVEFAIAQEVDRALKIAFSGITLSQKGDKLDAIALQDTTIAVASSTPTKLSGEFEYTFNREFINVVKKLNSDTVRVSITNRGRGAFIASGDSSAYVGRIEAKLPRLDPVLELKSVASIKVEKEVLEAAICQAAVFSDRDSSIITIAPTKEGIRLISFSQQSGLGDIDILAESNLPEPIGIDIRKLSSIVGLCDAETLEIEVSDGMRRVRVRDGNKTYIQITAIPIVMEV